MGKGVFENWLVEFFGFGQDSALLAVRFAEGMPLRFCSPLAPGHVEYLLPATEERILRLENQ